MVTTAPPPRAPARRPGRAGRIVALVLGCLLVLPALGLLVGGGVLLWAHGVGREDGVVVSPQDRFTSSGYALVSERAELVAGPDWLPVSAAVGEARVEVTPVDDRAVFVGIARPADAAAYLGDVRRTEVDALGFDSPAGPDDELPGGAPAAAPGAQDFWLARAEGPGTQQVDWRPDDGEWVFVVMNADGSGIVDVRARIGAEFPALGTVAWGITALGVVVALLTWVLLRAGTRVRMEE
ncbi:hypothetical protein ACI797_11885 [Geodermatophilus sp. SYSU D00691]